MLWPFSTHWYHGRSHRAGMDALTIRVRWKRRRSHHWMLWPPACAGSTDIFIVRAWVLWPFARTTNITDILIVRSWMLWPFARIGGIGNTDVLIVRAWMLWPFSYTINADVLIVRACMLWPHALVTRTLSSYGHGCSGHPRALVARTFSSRGRGCSGHPHALVRRAYFFFEGGGDFLGVDFLGFSSENHHFLHIFEGFDIFSCFFVQKSVISLWFHRKALFLVDFRRKEGKKGRKEG